MAQPHASHPTKPRILMMAAGTGGHVFPALAVAHELTKMGAEIHWLGTPNGMENELVANTETATGKGYPYHAINMQGLRGNGIVRLLKTPKNLMGSTLHAIQIIKQNNIDAVVGFGGYVTAPGGLAAKLCKKPIVIHEQNAIAGMSNRYLAKMAKIVMQAFPNTFGADSDKIRTVGNPVREAIIQVPSPEARINPNDTSPLKLLIVGGSLGSKPLNDVIAPTLKILETQAENGGKQQWQVQHQCGKNNTASTEAVYDKANLQHTQHTVMAFIRDMAAAYAWADIIVCRAGALTVTEIANVGVPAVFIPLPHAVDDHQTANAKLLVNENAAFLMPQSEMTPESLAEKLGQLDRATLLAMAKNAKKLANPHSSEQAGQIILSQIV